MPYYKSEECEKEGLLQASNLMLVSARTAPKTGGVDDILTLVVSGLEKDSLAVEMEKLALERDFDYKRDAQNVKDSEVVVLIGVRGTRVLGINCGACGYVNCSEYGKVEKKKGRDFTGPTCIFKALDLGIALSSAVKTASGLNIDNRMYFTIGAAARRLNLLPEASIIIGIALSANGKNIYFDRKTN